MWKWDVWYWPIKKVLRVKLGSVRRALRVMLYGCHHTRKNIHNNNKFEEDYLYNAKLDVISVTISPRIMVKED